MTEKLPPDAGPFREPPPPPPIPAGRRAARLFLRAWPFLAWCGALAAAGWLYFGDAGHGHALAIEDPQELKVSTSLAGRILKIAVEVGQPVREGDLIAFLETHDLDVRLTAARAELERTRARFEAWMKSEATKAGGGPDPRMLPFEQDLRMQEARLADLELDREKCRILAPAGGIVNRVSARAGEWRAAGSELLEILIPHPGRLTGYVTDRQISAVSAGTPATLRPRDLVGPPLRAKVAKVGPDLEPLPIRLRALPNVPQWGRRITFEVERTGESLPGQIYEVRFR